METHSTVLAWRIPGMEEPGGLPSMGSQRVRHDWSDLAAIYGEGNEDNVDLLQKVLCRHCYTQCPQPCSRPLLIHASARDSWSLMGKSGSVSLRGHCFFLLGPGAHKFLFVPSQSLFHQSCVSSGCSEVGLRVTSSKRAYAILRSASPRAPARAAVHCWPVPPEEILKHSSVSVSVGSLGPGVHKVCLSPLSISGGYGVWF